MITREIKTTCCYCGVGCGIIATTDGQRITAVRGDPDHPANHGKLCSKGSTLHLTTGLAGRALVPLQRRERGAPLQRARWNNTLDGLAARFAATIEQHGPDSVGFYVSGQLLTEDYYVFNKLAKGLIGTNNIDTNSRLCMSSAVAGYKETLGADAPPACYEDIDLAECMFIAGSNAAWAHPVLFRRIEAAKAARPDLKIIVVDPRRTATAEAADLFLQILPGTDVALFNGMLHVLLWEGLLDHAYIAAHTDGFAELKNALRDYPPAFVADCCGITVMDLVQAAKWFAASNATLSLYCQGLNQSSSGTAKNAALINLHLATGQIGKAGAGPFSLTGQPNAMGGREVGGMANVLPAHRELGNPAHRAEVARLWGIDAVSGKPGKTAVEMFDAVRSGEIKLLWIACTNPAQSMPDQNLVRAALRRAELVVLQEAFANTETAEFADVLLPAATWAEKEGTMTNSERRITHIHAAIAPPAEARPDWRIAADFGRRLEARLRPGKPSLFPYDTAEQVFNEHRETTRGRDLDITGLGYALLDDRGPQQWPFPEGAAGGRTRLYEDGVYPTANGRARFSLTLYKPVAEAADARYPFRLTTGRLRDQWHGMSRTGTLAQLFGHVAEPAVVMHPSDLTRRGLHAGDLVEVASRRGKLFVATAAGDYVRPGQAFLPMHWGSRFLGGKGGLGVNALTLSTFDPVSRQPELKHAAVRVTAAALPWRMVAFAFPGGQDAAAAAALIEAAAPLLKEFAYAVCVPFGRERPGVLLRLADASAPPGTTMDRIDALFGLDAAAVMRYDDPRRGVGRRIAVADGRLAGVRLSGSPVDLAAEIWLKSWLQEGESVRAIGPMLLSPSAVAPAGFVLRGVIVCNCCNVAAFDIESVLGQLSGPPVSRLAGLQAELRCGTECGSCLPELKRMVALAAEPTKEAA
jgi:assimilatory nitrate reductase catalytic subunit